MKRLLIFILAIVLVRNSAWANSCYALPDYIVQTKILSCKLLPVEKEGQVADTVLVGVEVLDELAFSTIQPISWDKLAEEDPLVSKLPLKGKKLTLRFEGSELSCLTAKANKAHNHTPTYYVARLCCDVGHSWCPYSNHQAWQLPKNKNIGFTKSEYFDAKYDFEESDEIKLDENGLLIYK